MVDNWHHQVDELIAYVEEQKQQQGADTPIIALGHSFGGVLSYLACCQRPDLFDRLVMLDPPLITGPAAWMFKIVKKTPFIDKLTPAGLTKIRRTRWHLEEDLVAYFSQKTLFKDMQERCIRDYVNAVTHEQDGQLCLHFDVDVETNIFRTLPTNLSKHYGKLQVPATLVTAKQSKVCVPKLYKPFLRGNPTVEHVCMPQGGHMFPLEHPEQVAAEIERVIGLG